LVEIDLRTGAEIRRTSLPAEWKHSLLNAHSSTMVVSFADYPPQPPTTPTIGLFDKYTANGASVEWQGGPKYDRWSGKVFFMVNGSGADQLIRRNDRRDFYGSWKSDFTGGYLEDWSSDGSNCRMTCWNGAVFAFPRFSDLRYDGPEMVNGRWAYKFVQQTTVYPFVGRTWLFYFDFPTARWTPISSVASANMFVSSIELSAYTDTVDSSVFTKPGVCPLDPAYSVCGSCCARAYTCCSGHCCSGSCCGFERRIQCCEASEQCCGEDGRCCAAGTECRSGCHFARRNPFLDFGTLRH